MNTSKGISLKLVSAVLFALMSALIRYLGARYPIGEVVFFRSAFAIVPVVVLYAWRGELAAAVRTENPLGQASRGALSIVGMFCNFGALARLPLIEANAISFTSPLIGVALAALVLKERVRIYRWSAVTVGFLGVLVVLAPHLSGDELTIAMASATSLGGVIYAIAGSVTNAGTMIQTRHLTKSERTSSIVFYFSLICALSGLATLPFWWVTRPGPNSPCLRPSAFWAAWAIFSSPRAIAMRRLRWSRHSTTRRTARPSRRTHSDSFRSGRYAHAAKKADGREHGKFDPGRRNPPERQVTRPASAQISEK